MDLTNHPSLALDALRTVGPKSPARVNDPSAPTFVSAGGPLASCINSIGGRPRTTIEAGSAVRADGSRCTRPVIVAAGTALRDNPVISAASIFTLSAALWLTLWYGRSPGAGTETLTR